MATPIKDTPVLTGKDAEKFIEKIKNPPLISEEETFKIINNYNKLKSILKDE